MNKEGNKEFKEFTKALTKVYNRNPKNWHEMSERLKKENEKKEPAFISELNKRIKEKEGTKHE